MSITQTYFLARSKLSVEALRPDHHLRLLVGHANLLDSLMIELAEAEQMQWFNCSVYGARVAEEPKHMKWAVGGTNLMSTLCYQGGRISRPLDGNSCSNIHFSSIAAKSIH